MAENRPRFLVIDRWKVKLIEGDFFQLEKQWVGPNFLLFFASAWTSGRFRTATVSGVFIYCPICLRLRLNIDQESIDSLQLINSR